VQNRHVVNQHFRFLLFNHQLFHVEARAFNLHATDLSPVLRFARHLAGVSLGSDPSVNSQFVQLKCVLFAELLRQSDHVGVGHVDARQPGHVGFALDPLVLLVNPTPEVRHPRSQFLVGLRTQLLSFPRHGRS
jgi:hypothetical protein